MTRRFHRGLSILACVALVGIFAIAVLMRRPTGPTAENFRRVHVGMSDKSALAVLGEPTQTSEGPAGPEHFWLGEQCRIIVRIDRREGKVASGFMTPTGWRPGDFVEELSADEGLLVRLRRWLEGSP
jgi:hypothetical protein